ncbi:MAG: 4Fe-4S dicluster domain-containing protein [Bacillota bacterium]
MSKGSLVLEQNRCKGCGLCITACAWDVLQLGEGINAAGYRSVEVFHEEACVGCALCAWMCPDLVIVVERGPELCAQADEGK